MEWLANYLSDPKWWIATVIGSITIHIVARRLDDRLPALFRGIANIWLTHSAKRKAESEKRITAMRENQLLVHYYLNALTRRYILAVTTFIMSGVSILLALNVVTYEQALSTEQQMRIYADMYLVRVLFMLTAALYTAHSFFTIIDAAGLRTDIHKVVLPPQVG